MTDKFGETSNKAGAPGSRLSRAAAADGPAHNIPALISERYKKAPAPLRTKMLESLLRPVGPLAIVTIGAGAFAHLLYRLRLNGIPISLKEAARISAEHVLDLARFVEQCSPNTLLQVCSLIPNNPIGIAAAGGTALSVARNSSRRQPHEHFDK